MTLPSLNVSSQSSSSTVDSQLGRLPINRDLAITTSNNISINGSRKTAAMGNSKQNATDIMSGEDLIRTTGSDYQEIQKRTLTKWVNAQLKLTGDHINNIETDFKDGRKLLKLLSVVSKEPSPKPEKMNMRIHQLANVAQALSFLEKQLGADSIVDMGNEAIVNGDKKKTLALIFFIMIKYQIQAVLNDYGDDFAQALLVYSDRQYDGLSLLPPNTNPLTAARKFKSNYSLHSDKQHSTSVEAKLALLYWVRIQLEDYIVANIIPDIQDFSRSWRNGLAFCLLIHRHEPDLMPDLFSYHLKDIDLTQKQTWHRLLTLSFDLATEHMHIPRYLDPEDLVDVDYPHEPSVMMYVSEFYKIMSMVQRNLTVDQRHQAKIYRRTAVGMQPDISLTCDQNNSLDDDTINTKMKNSSVDIDTGKRKKTHRRSTLAEEDKVRIKADLNNKLLMQLTGHLPRGVNPLLDQLLSIHDDLLAFIENNSKTLDGVPVSFDNADAVAECLDALHFVGEQMNDRSSLLNTARDLKDMLMLAPENVDESLICLTDLQQAQVKSLYDGLLNQWTDFEQLMATTKSELERMESDLANIEENVKVYLMEAIKVKDTIEELHKTLNQVTPRHPSNSDNQQVKWHPLDDCGEINKIADTYLKAAEIANNQVNAFDTTTWKGYRRFLLRFSRVVMKQVKPRLDELEQDHQTLMDANQETMSSSKDFSCALNLISTTKVIESELEGIRKRMKDDNTINDDIFDLMNQINGVRARIYSTRDTYDQLLAKDDRLAAHIDRIQQQYDTIWDSVTQVQAQFMKVERINKWIDMRINIINQRNGVLALDPLCDILPTAAQENSKLWKDEHIKLGRQIDRFDAEEMARLRATVESLGDNPAQASIMVATLDKFDQLMDLQHKQSYWINMLRLRIQWDELLANSSQWISNTNHDLDIFLRSDLDKRRHCIKYSSSGDPTQTLEALEAEVDRFRQSKYSECLDVYQDMENLHKSALPICLNTRQTHFVSIFNDLVKRIKLAQGGQQSQNEDLSTVTLDHPDEDYSADVVDDKWKYNRPTVDIMDPADLNNQIKHLQNSIYSLQAEIEGTDSALLSDDYIIRWQDQIDMLDRDNHNAILRGLENNGMEAAGSSTSFYDGNQQLDQVGEAILSTRNTLARLYDTVNFNRLCKIYGDNTKATQAMIEDTQKVLQVAQQIYRNGNGIKVNYDSLLDTYQEATQKIANCEEIYNDLCAYNSFIKTQKGNDSVCQDHLLEMATLQDTIDCRWSLLQAQAKSVSSMVSMASRLMDGYGSLKKAEDSAHAIRSNMKNNASVESLERLLRSSTAPYLDDVKSLLDTLDTGNASDLRQRFDQVTGIVSVLNKDLNQYKRKLEKSRLGEEVHRIQMACQDQLKLIRQQSSVNPDLLGKKPESIYRLILQPYSNTLKGITEVFKKCKIDFKTVLDQANHLVNDRDAPLVHLETITQHLNNLDAAILVENEYIGALKFVIKQGKLEAELNRSFATMKTTLLRYSKQELRARPHTLPDFVEFNRLKQDMEYSVQLFFLAGEDFKKIKSNKSIGVARISTISKAMEHYQTTIRCAWAEIKNMMDETKPFLDEVYRRQNGTTKLNETLLYVDDIKDRINTLGLSGKNATAEMDELKQLDKEIKVTLAKKLQEMDSLLESISDSDGIIRKQRAQLSTTTDQLYHLLQVRQEQANTKGNISLFLDIIDQVDERVLEVLVEIENTSLRRAKIIQGKYIKADVEELLRRLVGVYKKNGPEILKLLGSAKKEARKQFLDDNERVAMRLKKTMDRWTKAQLSASAREKELHSCINAMNHDFFTKLANTKKKTTAPIPNRRTSHPTDRSSTPGAASSSPSSSTSFGSLPPALGYTTKRRTSFQSSTVAADQRMATMRRSNTPTPTFGKPRPAYVSDPKNELDVQLGRIINNSAIKVNVKIVSDEVGKYYFGERLVYCRILPSKMVMVRVGGGWAELSHFLKDHGYTDNASSKQKSNQLDITGQQQQQLEDALPLVKSISPSGQANLYSRENSSTNRSIHKSTSNPKPSGYIDGDNFIHIGKDGNQVVMKMAKAVKKLP